MSYLASSKVYVYPCANRSNTYATSKFINEENIILNVGKRPNVDGFVISYNNNIIEFNLGGYYFNCDLTGNLTGVDIYAHIKVSDDTINVDSSATTHTTKQLVSIDSSKQLDEGDTFNGLLIDNVSSNDNYTYTLHILHNQSGSYIVPSESYGSVKSNEVLLNDNTTTISNVIARQDNTTNVNTDTLNSTNVNTNTLNAKDTGRVISNSLFTNKVNDNDSGDRTAINFSASSIVSKKMFTPTLTSRLIDLSITASAGNTIPTYKGLIDGYTNSSTPNYIIKIDENDGPIIPYLHSIDTVDSLTSTNLKVATISSTSSSTPININDNVQMNTGTTFTTPSLTATTSEIANLKVARLSPLSPSTAIAITYNASMGRNTTFSAYTLTSNSLTNTNTITTNALQVTQLATIKSGRIDNELMMLGDITMGTGTTIHADSDDDSFSITNTLGAIEFKALDDDITFTTPSNTTSIDTILKRLDDLGFKKADTFNNTNDFVFSNQFDTNALPYVSLEKVGTMVKLYIGVKATPGYSSVEVWRTPPASPAWQTPTITLSDNLKEFFVYDTSIGYIQFYSKSNPTTGTTSPDVAYGMQFSVYNNTITFTPIRNMSMYSKTNTNAYACNLRGVLTWYTKPTPSTDN